MEGKRLEPPTASDPGPTTYYAYDLLDHLTLVYMARSAGVQQRTFVYNNSSNQLASATNPENGTVTYTYNAFNKVATRTDPRGLQKQYTYDGIGRLTQVSRFYNQNGQWISGGACATDTYYYDSNPLDATYSQYTAGRLAAIQYGCGVAEMYSYHPAGAKTAKRFRLTRQNLPWDNNGNTTSGQGYGDLNSTYSYDNEGKMLGMLYPAGTNLSYGYDSMGRLNTMTDLASNTNFVTGVTYNAANQIDVLTGEAIEPGPVVLSRLSWKWKERSAVKITERTREESTKELHRRREGRHFEAAFVGTRASLQAV